MIEFFQLDACGVLISRGAVQFSFIQGPTPGRERGPPEGEVKNILLDWGGGGALLISPFHT